MTGPRLCSTAALFLVGTAAIAHAQPARVGPPPATAARPGAPAAFPPPPPAAPGPPPAATAPAANEPPLPGEAEALKECKKFPANKKFKWSVRGEVDLMTLLNSMTEMLCRPFIVPGNIRQSKVTILAPDTMTAPEAYRMFLSALEAMGLTVQPEGKVLKVIESNRARESAIPIYGTENNPPSQDQFVTRLLRLEHVTPDDVKVVLDRLRGRDGDITVYAPTNTLVITDLATNIRRMEEVVTQLDVPMGGEKIFVIKLHTVSAQDMATMLGTIFGVGKAGGGAPAGGKNPRLNLQTGTTSVAPSGAPGPPERGALGADLAVSQIIPDERTNNLIVVATEKAYQRIYALVKRLDQQALVPGDSSTDRVHVVPLENADADAVAGTLGGLGAGVSRSGSTTAAGGRPGAPPTTGTTGTTGQQGHGGPLFEGDVRVAPDKPTNSLVIVASGRDYITVRDLIKKLDIPRRQVFVEATILEISVDKSRNMGFAWHGGQTLGSGDSQSLLFGGSEPNSQVNSLLFSPAALSGLAAGLRGPPIPGAATILGLPPGTSIPSFGVFVQFLQNNGDVNVVSMPHILTTDNEKATIQVGQNLPFPGSLGGFPGFGAAPGAGGATGGASPGFGFGTSVQRQDVALKLEITPHVNDSDFVRLEIDNELSDVANPNFNGLGPATSKRTVKSVVTIRDQQSIVLGGLIKDRVSEQVDKVPLLGDIPILGYLFKHTTKSILKQNLLIILTPYIIKDPNDLRRIFERKVRERREFMERFSAFQDERDYEAEVDYRRKRGLLEEINRTALEAEEEANEVRSAEASLRGRDIEGEIQIPYVPPPPKSRLPPPQVPPPLPVPGQSTVPEPRPSGAP
ncbi:MAG TPA: type II secretion system secretin GspD [Polyangia bacterium]|nr:type II secretion system secretin GspD [Polyangia bacterium]